MLYHAQNGSLTLQGKTLDYISFGSGSEPLILLPGLGDGVKTVKGTALPFSVMYRAYAKQYKVYVFSRVNELEKGTTTKDMARDVKLAMDALQLPSAYVMGVSQGGMIAQYLALDYPSYVKKLILAVTLSKQNRIVQATVTPWIAMAEKGDYSQLMIDTAEKSYSEAYLRTHRWLFPLLGLAGKPKDFTRFIIQAESCLGHDAYARLSEIRCPTLVLGGMADKIVGAAASKEIADQIVGSELFMYEDLGHAAYEEAKDFPQRVIRFLQK
jgi:pimeloyl-ACP methyl ester carboxylesterase